MKQNCVLWTLAVLAVSALAAGCTKEQDFGHQPGTGIVFGAATSFENGVETRTEFSGKDENGRSITSQSQYERIDWVSGSDRFRILCEAAGGGKYLSGKADDYIVKGTPQVSNQKSLASIDAVNGGGLQWGSGNHYFYAMYPAPGMQANYEFSDKTVTDANAKIAAATGNKATMTCVVPATQNVVKVGNEYKANMNYNYMYAATLVKETDVTSSVPLSFHPLVTNFEFTLTHFADDPFTTKLTKIELSTTNATLTGTFKATLALDADGNPSAAIAKSGTPGKKVTVNLPGDGILLTSTPVKFNIITLPLEQTNLTLTLYFGSTKRILDLKKDGQWITVPACKKVYLNNLSAPGNLWNYYLNNIANITLTDAESGPGAVKDITVTSYRKNTDNTKSEGISWTAYALKEGTTNTYVKHGQEGWPSWCWLDKYTGTGNPNGESVHVYIAQETFSDAIPTEVVTQGDGAGMLAALRGATVIGTASKPRDLSMYSMYGKAYPDSYLTNITKAGPHTANCYVVSAPGHYCFPIVYGNAIDADRGNSNNVYGAAYKSQNTSLGNYLNADGKPIQSAYILKDSNLSVPTNLEAIVLWQDTTVGFRILDDGVPYDGQPWPLRVVDAPTGAGLTCKYIQFYIGPESIMPGNVIIALRDRDKPSRILWSWHIWVTTTAHSNNDNYFRIRNVKYRGNLSSPTTLSDIKLLHCPVGWTPPMKLPKRTTNGRTTKIRIVPDSGDAAPVTFTVTQKGITSPAYTGKYYSHCFYQWGRKDPFVGSSGGDKNKSVFSHYYTLGQDAVVVNKALSHKIASWIKLPYQFDTSGATAFPRYDLWNSNNKNNEFTSSNTGSLMNQNVKKTIYDPCPAGFSVPKGYAFTGFTVDGKNYAGDGAQAIDNPEAKWCGKKVGANAAMGRPASFVFSYNGKRYTSAADQTTYYTFYIPGSGWRAPDSTDIFIENYHGNAWTVVLKSDHVAWDFDWDNNQVEPLHANETYGFAVYPAFEQ